MPLNKEKKKPEKMKILVQMDNQTSSNLFDTCETTALILKNDSAST